MKPDRDYAIEKFPHPTLLHAFAALAHIEDRGVTWRSERGEDMARSFAALVLNARRRATWLRPHTSPGQPIGVALPNDMCFIETLFACWMLGALPVTLARPGLFGAATLERARHICEHAGIQYMITCPQEIAAFASLGGDVKLLEAPEQIDPALPAHLLDVERVKPSDAALIQYTSGSTARPRGVTLTHHNLARNCDVMTREFEFGSRESMTSWLPIYHDMGLIAELLVAIYRALPLFIMETQTFLQDPMSWFESITRHKSTITHIPNFTLSHSLRRISDAQLDQLDLSSMRALFLASEPIDPDLVARFTARFARAKLNPGAVGGAYGLAEATVGVTRTEPGEGLSFDHVCRDALADGHATPADQHTAHVARIACVGHLIPDHLMKIVSERGETLGARQVGEVWLSGASIMSGYWDDPVESEQALITDEAGRVWLKTGDLGYMVGDALHICGRIKELIIIRGRNYHPEEIERCAEQVEGVRAGQAIAFSVPADGGEQIVLVCETSLPEEAHEGLRAALRAAVTHTMGLTAHHVMLTPPNTTPKTTSGKRQRQLVKRLWLKHHGGA